RFCFGILMVLEFTNNFYKIIMQSVLNKTPTLLEDGLFPIPQTYDELVLVFSNYLALPKNAENKRPDDNLLRVIADKIAHERSVEKAVARFNDLTTFLINNSSKLFGNNWNDIWQAFDDIKTFVFSFVYHKLSTSSIDFKLEDIESLSELFNNLVEAEIIAKMNEISFSENLTEEQSFVYEKELREADTFRVGKFSRKLEEL